MQILIYSLTNYFALFSIQSTDFRATDIFQSVLALRDERVEFNYGMFVKLFLIKR